MKSDYLRRLRDEALYRVYVEGLENNKFSSLEKAADYVRLHPAPQFYIDAQRASQYISRLDQGQQLYELNSSSRRRIMEIYARYKAWRELHPDDRTPRLYIVDDIVSQEAPEFYLMHQQARKIIQSMNRKAKEQLLNKRQ